MGNIFYIDEDNPSLLAGKIEVIQDGCDPGRMEDTLQLDLDDLANEKRVGNRRHKRYQLKENAFALIRPGSSSPLKLRGKSMGCIACAVFNAKPVKLGKIENISLGGLMFKHVDSKAQLNEALVLDILMAGCGFYLADIAFKIITDAVIPDDVNSEAIGMRQVCLKFQILNGFQQASLKSLIIDQGAQFKNSKRSI